MSDLDWLATMFLSISALCLIAAWRKHQEIRHAQAQSYNREGWAQECAHLSDLDRNKHGWITCALIMMAPGLAFLWGALKMHHII